MRIGMSGCGYDPCAYEARYRRVYEARALRTQFLPLL